MKLLRRVILAIIFLIPFILVINFVPYPHSFEEASSIQILSLFITLLLSLTLIFNIFLNYLPRSFIAGLGIMIVALLQALGFLNYISGLVILIITVISIRFFPQIRIIKSTKIPKLKKLDKQKKR